MMGTQGDRELAAKGPARILFEVVYFWLVLVPAVFVYLLVLSVVHVVVWVRGRLPNR